MNATHSNQPVEHLVLIHGWGGDSRCWQALLDAFNSAHMSLPVTMLDLPGFGVNSETPWPDDETLMAQLAQQLPHNSLLLGWSLGGMLAVKLAAYAPQKVSALMTIAANVSFVGNENQPGMAAQVFEQFSESFAKNSPATLHQFCGLQARGDSAMRVVLRQLKNRLPDTVPPAWSEALQCLGRWDNRKLLGNLALPALHIFGEQDALVPVAATDTIQALGAEAKIIGGAGHAPHISQAGMIAEITAEFIASAKPVNHSGFDKSAVARSFGRAAASYDEAAHLQRAVCRQLLADAASDWSPRRILDLGSGTGYGSELLRQRFPQAEIIALDIAPQMLAFARSQRPAASDYIAADAEQLPLADASIDLVFSSLALQWCYQLPQLFAEMRRVMTPGAHSLIATLGPDTLRELKQSWAQVDNGVHVNRFLPADDWRLAAEQVGLVDTLRVEERVLHFNSVTQLMRELKSIGAHNVNRGADKGLLSRAKLRTLTKAYEAYRSEVGLPASYEVVYLALAHCVGEMAAPERCGVE